LAEVRAKGASKKIWDPLSISTTVEASNFKFGIQLVLGEELAKKQRLRPKLAGIQARGASKKLGPDIKFISATVEASNLRFGTQFWLKE